MLVGNVQCKLKEGQASKAATLKKGDWVTIQGRCSGLFLGTVMFGDCELFSNQEPERTVDRSADRVADTITGDIVGKWHEGQFTQCDYILRKKEGKLFMKRLFSDLSGEEYELDTQKIEGEIRYYNHNRNYKYYAYDTITKNVLYSDSKKEGYLIQPKGTEYFTINSDGELMFSDSEQANYTRGTKF